MIEAWAKRFLCNSVLTFNPTGHFCFTVVPRWNFRNPHPKEEIKTLLELADGSSSSFLGQFLTGVVYFTAVTSTYFQISGSATLTTHKMWPKYLVILPMITSPSSCTLQFLSRWSRTRLEGSVLNLTDHHGNMSLFAGWHHCNLLACWMCLQ